MIHPDTELRFISPSVGYGVFATALIPQGTLTWVQDELDLVLTPDHPACRSPDYGALLERFAFRDPRGRLVLCWDFGRFMNHSCEPSCVCIGTLCDIAARDIQRGEQLTCEYGLLNLSWTLACQCGSAHCRGQIHGQELRHHARAVDASARTAAARYGQVAQPLLPFMLADQRDRLLATLAGRAPFPSCLDNLPSP